MKHAAIAWCPELVVRVLIGLRRDDPVEPLRRVIMFAATMAKWPPFIWAHWVRSSSSTLKVRWVEALANSVRYGAREPSGRGTMKGLSVSTTCFQKPFATRLLELATRRSSMIDLPRSEKSMHSQTGCQPCWPLLGFW
ncbi:hypothetical protein D3C78_1451380 [compost metagenome]